MTEKLQAKERNILTKILSLIKENGEYRKRYNHKCTQIEKIMTIFYTMRIAFYGHVAHISPQKVIIRIFIYFINKKTKGPIVHQEKKWSVEVGIIDEGIQKCDTFKKKLAHQFPENVQVEFKQDVDWRKKSKTL